MLRVFSSLLTQVLFICLLTQDINTDFLISRPRINTESSLIQRHDVKSTPTQCRFDVVRFPFNISHFTTSATEQRHSLQ